LDAVWPFEIVMDKGEVELAMGDGSASTVKGELELEVVFTPVPDEVNELVEQSVDLMPGAIALEGIEGVMVVHGDRSLVEDEPLSVLRDVMVDMICSTSPISRVGTGKR
jgi:hypothetical protein